MKGALLKKGQDYYTYLSKVFVGINNVQKDYNWLITNSICYIKTSEYKKLSSQEYCWITGVELSELIKKEYF